MNSMGKAILGQNSATLHSYLLFTNLFSNLSIGGSPPNTTSVCEDFILQVLFTGDRQQRVGCNTNHNENTPLNPFYREVDNGARL